MKRLFLVILIFRTFLGFCQNDTMTIILDKWGKDDRFHKYENTLALFKVQGDTIQSMDFEDLKPAIPIIIKKPIGYKNYAYGYLFFAGSYNIKNEGFVTVLVGDYNAQNPTIWVDNNQNFDFTDDPKQLLPYYYQKGIEIELDNSKIKGGKNKILLTRTMLFGKLELRKQKDDYYKYYYKDRSFIGLDLTYREQRYLVKSGIVKLDEDSFRIGLHDGNYNGKFNDIDTDRVVIINYNDSVFDTTNELFANKLSKDKKNNYFEKNGKIFEVLSIDPAGNFIVIKQSNSDLLFGKIAVGKKIPKVSITTHKGEKKNLKKLSRHQVFMYFTSLTSKNFEKDTAILRKIAAIDSCKVRVIMFLYTNKSYTVRIFGSQSKANYTIALGHKLINKKLGIRGLPQTLLIGKRRKVIKYGLSPEEYLNQFQWRN
ncbi:MAG: hypothetical protein K9G64_01195 [Bacteroidia bacterium]|nr:hypothetical protein [Bacteroidia bacterium]